MTKYALLFVAVFVAISGFLLYNLSLPFLNPLGYLSYMWGLLVEMSKEPWQAQVIVGAITIYMGYSIFGGQKRKDQERYLEKCRRQEELEHFQQKYGE